MHHQASKLTLGPGKEDHRNTGVLQRAKLQAKNDGSLQGAIVSAGFYAKKLGKTVFVYPGNSFGHLVWRVSYKPGDYLSPINNTGVTIFSVTPELVLSQHEVDRPSAPDDRVATIAQRYVASQASRIVQRYLQGMPHYDFTGFHIPNELHNLGFVDFRIEHMPLESAEKNALSRAFSTTGFIAPLPHGWVYFLGRPDGTAEVSKASTKQVEALPKLPATWRKYLLTTGE